MINQRLHSYLKVDTIFEYKGMSKRIVMEDVSGCKLPKELSGGKDDFLKNKKPTFRYI